MMDVWVARVYRFRAHHSLPGFPEPWCHDHWHDYQVEVMAAGGTDTDLLDARWSVLCPPDGCDMNLLYEPSTVENIAVKLLQAFMAGGLPVDGVRVAEDRERYALAQT